MRQTSELRVSQLVGVAVLVPVVAVIALFVLFVLANDLRAP